MTRAQSTAWLTEHAYAHRGLFRPGSRFEENTLASVALAVDRGYGVEVDVRITADEQIIVFHDATLDRLTAANGSVSSRGYGRLSDLMVGSSGEPIPRLVDMLDLVEGRAPILLEIKREDEIPVERLSSCVRRAIEGYKGPLALMSFDARVIDWFAQHFPTYVRGLVLGRKQLGGFYARLKSGQAVKYARPDFLAVEVSELQRSLVTSWRQSARPVLSWTVRDQTQQAFANTHADALIFEFPGDVSAHERECAAGQTTAARRDD